ncbi:hypothetical protein H920_16025 [Fukomys damarensis]|uniref:Uncharacterized protein n=1 Tax=Fukomys damarensis TaxID=885580 RepID=A0A091CXG5_FUKDA|nr:hypothetical protein H920_16025 [Fukomys damarensis]
MCHGLEKKKEIQCITHIVLDKALFGKQQPEACPTTMGKRSRTQLEACMDQISPVEGSSQPGPSEPQYHHLDPQAQGKVLPQKEMNRHTSNRQRPFQIPLVTAYRSLPEVCSDNSNWGAQTPAIGPPRKQLHSGGQETARSMLRLHPKCASAQAKITPNNGSTGIQKPSILNPGTGARGSSREKASQWLAEN